MNPVLRWMGGRLATYLAQPIRGAQTAAASLEQLAAALKPGDVLLVEGNTRVSVAIKYLTQSTWSHAMFYIGDALGSPAPGEAPKVLVEADILYGIRAVPLSDVSGMNTRICRPVGMSKEDLQAVIRFTPLYQGVVIERSLVLGDIHWTLLAHAAYLALMGAIGLRIAARRIVGLLQP